MTIQQRVMNYDASYQLSEGELDALVFLCQYDGENKIFPIYIMWFYIGKIVLK